jgi:retinol dehydrogenase 12
MRAVFFSLMKIVLARTTEVGSRTLVAGAAAGEESHGMYMQDCEVAEPSAKVRSSEGKKTQDIVWKELKEVLEGMQPGVVQNI